MTTGELTKFCVRLPREMADAVRDAARKKGQRIEQYVQSVLLRQLKRDAKKTESN